MMRRLRNIISDLKGSGRRHFVALLDDQLEATHQAVELIDSAFRLETAWTTASAQIADIEHRGDDARALLVVRLSNSVVTPVDREDLFRISRSIDDVLDNMRDFVRECDLFEPQHLHLFPPIIARIGEAVVLLRSAVQTVLTDPTQINERSLAAKKAGNQIRRCYDEQLAELFNEDLTVELLKARELLRRLDVVGLRLGEAADALADAAVKRSEH